MTEWEGGLGLNTSMLGNERAAGCLRYCPNTAGESYKLVLWLLPWFLYHTGLWDTQGILVMLTHSEKWFCSWWVTVRLGVPLPALHHTRPSLPGDLSHLPQKRNTHHLCFFGNSFPGIMSSQVGVGMWNLSFERGVIYLTRRLPNYYWDQRKWCSLSWLLFKFWVCVIICLG